jgi:CubicO group peptidase (beta-lactamase class C family)
MIRLIRLLLLVIFALAACEDPTEEIIDPEGNVETPADTTQDIPADSVAGDTSETTAPQPPVENPVVSEYYYPPVDETGWTTVHPDSIGWNTDSLEQVLSFVSQKNTFGFIILHRGRIVTEKYWQDWNATNKYPIASAGKTVTSFLTGIAQQEGLLNINNMTSDYIGAGWTSLTAEKENLIQIRHLLTMTSGLDEVEDVCQDASCLKYKTDAGTRWAYHNGPYFLLNKVLSNASATTIDEFTKTRLGDKIGLRNWSWENNILSLSTRDMARFGLLMLSKGKWADQLIMSDSTYFNSMISPSNDLNKSYGYLWWLNGQDSYMIPEGDAPTNGALVTTAPADMYAAMGKGDKKIYIVPSLDVVVVRHGDDTGENTFGPSSFDTELWNKLKGLMKF